MTDRDLSAELQRGNESARTRALASPETIQLILKNVLVRRMLTQEARSNGLAAEPDMQTQLRLNEERLLSDARMLQLDKGNAPEDAALDAYARTTYQANTRRYEVPAQTHARHILISDDSAGGQAEAEKLLAQIRAGGHFEELAKTHSKDPGSAAKGGDLGFFAEGRMVPEFDAALKAMTAPGQVSGLVKTQFGWHIIQLVERRPARIQAYEEVRESLVREARQKILADKRVEKINALASDSKYDEAAIKAFVEKSR